jgi:hypothetical protein
VVGNAERIEKKLGRDLLPKSAQLFEPRLGCIAGDQRRIDRADRNSGNPIGMQVRLGQPLIHAGLKGTERSAPLQHQGDAVEGRALQFTVALQQRLDEVPADILGGLRRSFGINGRDLAFRRQRRDASRSVGRRHATTIRVSGYCFLELDRIKRKRWPAEFTVVCARAAPLQQREYVSKSRLRG